MKHSTYTLIGIFGIAAECLAATRTWPMKKSSTPEPGTLGAAIPDTQLASNRGGHTLELNTNNLDAKLYENQANSQHHRQQLHHHMAPFLAQTECPR